MGLMTTRDFENYFSLFNTVDGLIGAEFVNILRANVGTLAEHIQSRGRDYEQSINIDYLKRLNERYEAWASTYDNGKMLIIDVDNNNFKSNKEDLGKIVVKLTVK